MHAYASAVLNGREANGRDPMASQYKGVCQTGHPVHGVLISFFSAHKEWRELPS
jgi:hypothetical protein